LVLSVEKKECDVSIVPLYPRLLAALMTHSDDTAPRNVQNVAEGASATQITDPTAPVVVNPKDSTIHITTIQQAAPKPPLPEMPSNLPQWGSETFVGRADTLETLHQQLQQAGTVSICAVSGMGGIGKTELALQYASKHQALKTYPGAVCWLDARSQVGMKLLQFAQTTLNLTLPELPDLVQQAAWIWGQFPAGECLIVMDDVQDYDDVKPFLPPAVSRFKVVMTTRSQPPAKVRSLRIEVLSDAAALELLRALVGDARIDQDLVRAQQLCEWLGYLPLGLELVGRYLARKPDVSLAVLWERLQAKWLTAQALKQAHSGMTASLGVAEAFELSWQDLPPEAQQLAKLLSLFAPAEIPWALVQQCLPEWDEEALEDVRDEKLCGSHLLWRTDAGLYQVHQLLREFFAAKLHEPERTPLKTAFATVMIGIAKRIPQSPTLEQIRSVTAAIPHLKEVATDLEQLQTKADLYLPDEDDLTWAFIGISRFYGGQGLYAEAEPWKKDCLAVVRSLLGEEHPAVAASLNNLAELYRAQGRYDDAEPLYLQALQLVRSLLGEQHPNMAASLNNLALLYQSQGHYEDAEPLYLQALQLRRSLFGEEHPNVATSLNNLALLYQSQGRYEDAEPLYLQALQLRRSLFGEEHPNVATSLNNLAGLYDSQGRYELAEPLYLQALQLMRSLLGEQHPDVATSLNNLAALYKSQGRYELAEPLYLQALQLRRSLLGEQHPDVAASLNNLAVLYANQGRFTEAEPLLVQALQRYQQLLGTQHPHTATMQQSLEYLRQMMG
jgi:tetratricopeptide (TPR) repeat protein